MLTEEVPAGHDCCKNCVMEAFQEGLKAKAKRIVSKLSKLKDIIEHKSKHIGNNFQSRETRFFVCGMTIGIGTGYLIGVALGSKIMKNATKGLTNTKE